MPKRIHSSNQTSSKDNKSKRIQSSISISSNSNNGLKSFIDNTTSPSANVAALLPPQTSSVNDDIPSVGQVSVSVDTLSMSANDLEPLRCMECRTLLLDHSMSFLLKNFNFPVCDSCR